MYYDGQHICKSPDPIDAVTFNITGAGETQVFNGVLKITIHRGKDDHDDTTMIVKLVKKGSTSRTAVLCF